MATATLANPMNNSNYYVNPPAGPSPPEAYQYGNKGYASASGTPPSSNISPTSNHSALNVRQLRQPRQPLYTPAALRPPKDAGTRPTDIPGRPRAPDTPPASNESSFDSAKAESPAVIEFAAGMPFGAHTEQDVNSMRRGLSRAASEDYNEAELGEVTGPPTTAHWKPDESAPSCYVCNESFTWYFRRHHCRRCGNLVCDYHIKNSVPLDQNARYHPQGLDSKACKPCFDGWRVIRKLHHSRTNSIAESSSSGGTAMPIPNLRHRRDDVRIGSMARSEGGMVWSTF